MRGAFAIVLLLCMQTAFAQDHSQHAMPPSSPTATDWKRRSRRAIRARC